jgi:hypothetical protein
MSARKRVRKTEAGKAGGNKNKAATVEDTRRYCDGVRLYPYLGNILAYGARGLRQQFPHPRISNLEFSRSAIPQLSRRGLIYLVEARVGIPPDLPWFLKRIVKRDQGSPIWLPTDELAVGGWMSIWEELAPVVQDGCIIWPEPKSAQDGAQHSLH